MHLFKLTMLDQAGHSLPNLNPSNVYTVQGSVTSAYTHEIWISNVCQDLESVSLMSARILPIPGPVTSAYTHEITGVLSTFTGRDPAEKRCPQVLTGQVSTLVNVLP